MAVTFKRPVNSGTHAEQIKALSQWAVSFINELERKLSSIEKADLSETFRQELREREEETKTKLTEMSEEIERLSVQVERLKGE